MFKVEGFAHKTTCESKSKPVNFAIQVQYYLQMPSNIPTCMYVQQKQTAKMSFMSHNSKTKSVHERTYTRMLVECSFMFS